MQIAVRTCAVVGTVGVIGFSLVVLSAKPPVAEKGRAAKIPIGKSTTFLTEPLNSAGHIDYVKGLNQRYGKGIKPGENAAVAFLKSFGPREIPAKFRPPLYKRLRIEPLPTDGNYYVPLSSLTAKLLPPKRFVEQQKLWREFDKCQAGPWKIADSPRIAKWIAANEEPLEIFASASRKPSFFLPFLDNDNDGFGVRDMLYSSSRQAGRILRARAMLHFGEGRYREALQDLLTCRRWARQLHRDPIMISTLLGTAVSAYAYNAELHLAHSGKLSAKQAAAHVRQLGKLGPVSAPKTNIGVTERCLLLNSAIRIARDPKAKERVERLLPAEGGGKTPRRAPVRPGKSVRKALRNGPPINEMIDWEIVLTEVNGWFDRAEKAAALTDRNRRNMAIRAFDRQTQRLRSESRRIPDFLKRKPFAKADRPKASRWLAERLIAQSMNYLSMQQSALDRANARFHLTRLAFALAAYRADKGKSPAKLSKLKPAYIGSLPVDPFSGKPFRYSATKNGYLLYGVGANGIDDGGLTYGEGEGADDIVVRTPAH